MRAASAFAKPVQTETARVFAESDNDDSAVVILCNSAIGHPDRFFTLLADHGLDVEPHALPDHAPLGADDLSFDDDKPVFITEKDEVKCKHTAADNVWCVVVDLRLGEQDSERLLRTLGRLLGRAGS